MRYIVFGGDYHLRSHGALNYITTFDSCYDAIQYAKKIVNKNFGHVQGQLNNTKIQWSNVLDIEDKSVVYESDGYTCDLEDYKFSL